MKKIYIYALASLILGLGACKDDFLEEKKDWSGYNEETFKDPLLAQSYVDYIYGLFLPANNAQSFIISQAATENGAYSSVFTQTTEELGGETDYNKEWAQISYINNHANKYFGQKMGTGINNNTWTRLKQINIFLSEIDKYGIDEATRNKLKGQLYFWRAWQYFELVRLYGGVPLVLTPQDPILAGEEAKVPRSSSSQTIEQICADLDLAKTLLPGRWTSASDWGRITSGAAAALKGRVLLTWASPLFNRNDDKTRWQRAYDANTEAVTILNANSFNLYQTGTLANATAWGNMFLQEENNPEAVIVFGFNNLTTGNTQKNNGMEQAMRPKEILGSGSISPTKEMLDAFPMKDGKPRGSSTYEYSLNKFYKNRDPRFYKTFAYNGALWPYSGNTNYKIWTYQWKATANASAFTSTEGSGNANGSGIYLRKASDPNATNANQNFSFSKIDFMEMRYAEVVLNLAESAIGIDKYDEGLAGIESIRRRAGVENLDGHYGLADVVGNRDRLFAAVLNERKVEFAYEGKRFWDLRRWLLFDDTYGTLTRLQMAPLNGTRRTGIQITVKTSANGAAYVGAADPLKRVTTTGANPPLADRDPASLPSGTTYDQYLDNLYDNYFVVSVRDDLDRTNPANWKFTWYPQYYFFGLHTNVLQGSPYLEQTVGWDGNNGPGTFDPLK